MSKVPQKQSKQELLVCKFLYSHGLRYRKNLSSLPGSPDIAITKYKIAIFVHGCFWHGHVNCTYSKGPSSNIEFWGNKIDQNINRDLLNADKLKRLGWRVIELWQCQLKNKIVQNETLSELLERLKVLKSKK